MKTNKIIYWIATGFLCILMIFSATMYITKHEMSAGFFEALHFPTWLVYPLAVAKILGVIAILSKKSNLLKEWAYAGMFFDMVLAFTAHIMAADGAQGAAALGLIALVVSRFYDSKIYGSA